MKEHSSDYRKVLDAEKQTVQHSSNPVWQDQQITCGQCRFSDQDIDTYPCAKCHTRH